MPDKKVSQLETEASLAATDVIYVVADPGSSPVSKKATIQQILDLAGGGGGGGGSGPLVGTQSTLGDAVMTLSSIASGDDPTQEVFQGRITTADATTTTALTIALTDLKGYLIEAMVIGRRTAGDGAAGDFYACRLLQAFRREGGGATFLGSLLPSIEEFNSTMTWVASMSVSGNDVLVRVTGDGTTDITWHVTARVWKVGS
jgi:hypothetical protein